MVLVITQETFDNLVRENIEEFEMSAEEAIQETIEQFKAQGVDLSHIVTDWMASRQENNPVITEAIKTLDNLIKRPTVEPSEFIPQLEIIKNECTKGLNCKILAGKEGAYHVILAAMLKAESNKEATMCCLKAIIALMTKQPDLLDEEGIRRMICYLDQQKDLEVIGLVLKWIKECCVLHEMNRQSIFNADVLAHIKLLLSAANAEVLRDVLAVIRALVLDDDVRVEFGRSHEHARTIASDTLCVITVLLDNFKKDELVINDIMLTLSALLVRTEFCEKLEDAGGLKIIHDAMIDFQENDKIIKQCFKVLKALAGNDECKAHIIQEGNAPVIVSVMDRHKTNVNTAIIGLGCVAALTLRNPNNSKALFEAGIPEVIADIMKLHPDSESAQQYASWAIRNMVSRSRYQNKKFLDLDIENMLKENLKKFKKLEYDMKAALRDLGCAVQLKEEWTGKGGRLTTQARK